MRIGRIALAAVLAAACSSGSGSKPSTLPTLGTPSATAAPTAVPLVVPAIAREHTRVGAAEFVKFFFTELDRAYQAGTPFPLDGLADPACDNCKNFAGAADTLAKDQQHFAGRSFEDITAESPPVEKGFVYVDFGCRTPTRVLLNAAGQVVDRYPQSARLHLTVAVMQTSDGWLVRAMKNVP